MEAFISNDGNSITVNVPVIVYKRGDQFISYCPMLDLMSYSRDQELLKAYFKETLDTFIEYESKSGTLHATLIGLGWNFEKEVSKPRDVKFPAYMLESQQTSMNVPVAIPCD